MPTGVLQLAAAVWTDR